VTLLPHEKAIEEYENTIEELKKQNDSNGLWSQEEIRRLEGKLGKLKERIYSKLNSWERITIARHPKRPRSSDYIKHLFTDFQELCGDRTFADDRAIIGGFAQVDDCPCVVIGHEKGNDTESRIHHNFGMPQPEGYRKALRMMKLAEKFSLPIICLVDTPGAYPGLTAEERGQGWAIANNLMEMSQIKTQIIIVLIGEGGSGGALGIGVGDHIGMLQHSYFSVITPEGCASILWKDAGKNTIAAESLKLNAEDLKEFAIIDTIIEEPQGGAHHNPETTYANVKDYILEQITLLNNTPLHTLLEKRYQKFRQMGSFADLSKKSTTQTEPRSKKTSTELLNT